jgi:hypothetical protein
MLGYPEQALRHIDWSHALPQRRCSRFDLGAIMQREMFKAAGECVAGARRRRIRAV